MTTEDRLRRALGARASEAEPSAAGWDRIQARIEPGSGRRRPRRPATRSLVLIGMASITVVALAAALLSRSGNGSPRLVASGQPTTIETVAAATTPPPAAYAGIFPDTPADLAQLAAAAQQGAQAWRGDPAAVAAAYLESVGLPNPTVSAPAPVGALAVTVGYQASGWAGGTVDLARAPDAALYYVTGSSASGVDVEVDTTGSQLDVTILSTAGGTASVRSRPLDGSFGTASSTRLAANRPAHVMAARRVGPAVVQVRIQRSDGLVALSERRAG